MTNGQGYGPQDEPWPPRYDPRDHGHRLRGPQGQPPPQEQEWQQPGYSQQPYPGQSQYPPQGQPWQQAGNGQQEYGQPPFAAPQQQPWGPPPGYGPQQPYQQPPPGYQPPQGPPPGWQPGYGQQPPWGPQPGYQPPQPPPRKPWIARHKVLSGLIAFGCLIVLIIVANSGGSSSSSGAANTATQAAAPSSAAATTAPPSASPSKPPAAHTVATYSGSGIENTPQFSVTATWKLDYSFDCSDFGYKGNFIVMEDGSFGAMSVNGLAISKSGSSYAYNDAGTHYLEINSECSWTVKIIDEG